MIDEKDQVSGNETSDTPQSATASHESTTQSETASPVSPDPTASSDDAFATVTDDGVEDVATTSSATPSDIPDNAKLIDYGPSPNVTLTVGNPLGDPLKRPFDDTQDAIDIPSLAMSEFGPVTSTYKNYRLAVNPETARWQQSASSMPKRYLAGGAFENSFKDPEAHWRQSMLVGNEEIRPDRPKFMESTGNRLSGEEARLRIRAVLSAGNRVRVPLWHSGVWITLKPPAEMSLLELDQRIANMKVELGRLTDGLVFAQTSVYMVDAVVDFIMEHVSETSYQGTLDELRTVILQPDYQQMVWGMLCAIYTDGYIYQQPCMVNPFKCLHVETGRLNFGKMSFVNNNAFTDFQRMHMRKRKAATQSKADVERYQSEHKFQRNSTVKLHDHLAVELKVPSLQEYVESGRDWVEASIEAVDNVFGRDMDADTRNLQIKRYANLSVLQQYSHWVRVISVVDGENPENDLHVDDRDSIQETLADLTSDNDVFKNFFEGIKTYMDGIMINIHGIPKYPCPRCGETPHEDTLKHPMVFPIDLPETFFTLVDQRIRRMLVRRTF